MPLSDKGRKILSSMQDQYGDKKGESVFYASINKGRIKGAEGSSPRKKKRGIAGEIERRQQGKH